MVTQKAVSALLLCSLAASAAATVPASLYNQLQWRMIGPFRGGRVVSVAGVPGDPATFYFGSVGGGVWKTTNAGVVWSPVFDRQPIASIGALAVATSQPGVIYAGTGETDIRSQIGFGDGVYKSADAGKTWQNVGLRETRQIAKILVDPRNPDTLLVAALGHVYGPNPERGVFRSADGGRTWQKVLFTNPETGAADLAWDPAKPEVVYAVMWNAHRPPWSVYAPIEGPGTGLWKSVDGGLHWTHLEGHGLPAGNWRRSGVAVAPGGRVYFLIDGAGGGMFRSDDNGENWTRTAADSRLTSRSWYFGHVTADPKNPDLVYVPNVAPYRSADGGKTFTVLKGAPGGDDYQALWIDPTEPRRMIQGSDQGVSVSIDAGASWSTWYNQPTAQMYHVVTDHRFPYNVYGSQQDSGTAAVASRTDHGQIDARDWFSVGGAEAGYIAIDPADENILYVGNSYGALTRFDRRTAQAQNIMPSPGRGFGFGAIATQKYRFPWTAPLVFSQSEPDTLYYGSQYVLKTTDGGLTWKEISPDLTGDTRADKTVATPNPAPADAPALGYGVVYSIGPSPIRPGLVWAGSDTGLLWVTRDGGAHWDNVTPPGLPQWGRVTQFEASHFDPAEAWAAVDHHRMEDYKPYVYRTRDYGKTWTPAVDGLAEPAYLNGIREDPARRGLLYAATELGVAVSFDDGDHWQPLQLNLPAVSVRDLVVNGDDLVIATHGRGFWILDDITPFRQIDARSADAEAILYKPGDAIRLNPEDFMGTPFPPEEPKAKNPPEGAILDYWFRTPPAGEVTLEILDAQNQLVRRYSSAEPAEAPARRAPAIADIWISRPQRLTAAAGMNRFTWDLRYAAPRAAAGAGGEFGRAPAGPFVMPGTYRVRLTAAGHTYEQPVVVKLDPRSKATPADLEAQFDLSMKCWRAIERASGSPQVAGRLSTALGIAQSADRRPPQTAYQLYEDAVRDLGRP